MSENAKAGAEDALAEAEARATDCAAIVLAAGASTRLGRPKQFVRIEGESLLRRAARLASAAGCSPVFVVLGYNAAALAEEVKGVSISVVVNREWQTGMASSLKTGLLAVLAANPEQASVMVAVCDQPRLDLSILKALLVTHSLHRSAIIASRYLDTLGVPAIFSKPIFDELLQLTGDQGARRILQRHREEVVAVDFPGGDFDLDTPEDLAQL